MVVTVNGEPFRKWYDWTDSATCWGQLATAILSHECELTEAVVWSSRFKWTVVAHLPAEWTLTSDQIRKHLEAIQAEAAKEEVYS